MVGIPLTQPQCRNSRWCWLHKQGIVRYKDTLLEKCLSKQNSMMMHNICHAGHHRRWLHRSSVIENQNAVICLGHIDLHGFYFIRRKLRVRTLSVAMHRSRSRWIDRIDRDLHGSIGDSVVRVRSPCIFPSSKKKCHFLFFRYLVSSLSYLNFFI